MFREFVPTYKHFKEIIEPILSILHISLLDTHTLVESIFSKISLSYCIININWKKYNQEQFLKIHSNDPNTNTKDISFSEGLVVKVTLINYITSIFEDGEQNQDTNNRSSTTTKK